MKKQRATAIRKDLSPRVEVTDAVTWREVGGDVVILNLETGNYFGLDGPGAQMWRELVDHGSLEQTVVAVTQQFDVESEQLRHDLEALVNQLVKKGLVQIIAAQPRRRSR